VYRDQCLGELCDLCYWRYQDRAYNGVCGKDQVQLFITKDSIMKVKKDKKVAYDYHSVRTKATFGDDFVAFEFSRPNKTPVEDKIQMEPELLCSFKESYEKMSGLY